MACLLSAIVSGSSLSGNEVLPLGDKLRDYDLVPLGAALDD